MTSRRELLLSARRSPRRTALHIPAALRPPPPSAFARFGAGSWVVPPARITGAEAIEIGDGVIVLELAGFSVDAHGGARLVIGDGARLAMGIEVVCAVSVAIGPRVSTSDNVSIVDTWGPVGATPGTPPPPPAPVVVEEGAYLGWGSVIGPGVTIGRGAYVGEGAVVLEDVPAHAIVRGNPARS